MKKISAILLFLTCISFACSRKDTVSVQTLSKQSAGELHMQQLNAVKKNMGIDKIEHKLGETRDWRKAWEFYQELPKMYTKKGYTDEKILQSIKIQMMVMIMEPHRFAALINESFPTLQEALKMIEESEKLLAFSGGGKAVIYRYLQNNGMQLEADNFMERTKKHNGDASKVATNLKQLIVNMEKYPPNSDVKDKKFDKRKKEYDYKLSVLKKMATL